MAIDPRLYQKITGRLPGEPMQQYGETLGKQKPRGGGGDTSFFASLVTGHRYLRTVLAIVVLGTIIAMWLFGGRWI